MARNRSKFNYYDAFIRQADLAVQESQLLTEIVETFTTAQDLQTFLPKAHEIENEADLVCHDIYDALVPDFVPPLDREDIMTLAGNLDEVVDKIEELIQSFYMYDVHFMHDDAKEFAKIIFRSCDTLRRALGEFAHAKKSETLKHCIVEINDLEEEADALYLALTRKLFTVERDHFVRVMVWSNIFEIFEECADQCEFISSLLANIVLKMG